MNIVDTCIWLEAKTSGFAKNKIVSYRLIESAHSLSFDKREIILAQIQACEKLIKFTTDPTDIGIIKREIEGLRLALDMTNY